MKHLYLPFYNEIIKNDIINTLDSIYWIYSIENFIIKQNNQTKRYLKVYFFNRCYNEQNNLMQLHLNFCGENLIIKDYQIAQEYNDPNVMGFIHEIDVKNESKAIKISGYTRNGQYFQLENHDVFPLTIDSDTHKINILKDFILKDTEDVQLFPMMQEYYWSCFCGYINSKENLQCTKCGHSLHNISNYTNLDLHQIVLNNIHSKFMISIDTSIDTQLKKFCSDAEKTFGIPEKLIYEKLDVKNLRQQQSDLLHKKISTYLQNNKMLFNESISFEENIHKYCQPLCSPMITEETILSYMDMDELDKNYYDTVSKYKHEQNKKKIRTIILAFLGCGILISAIVGLTVLKPNKKSVSPPVSKNLPVQKPSEPMNDVDSISYVLQEHVVAGVYSSYAIHSNGTLEVTPILNNAYNYGQSDILNWKDIKMLASGQYHTVALLNNGTLSATTIKDSRYDVGQSDIRGWSDIKQVSTSTFHTVALRNDGTVISTQITDKNYDYGQTDVSNWKDIVEISAGYDHTIGLKKDGTVIATKITNNQYDYGETQVEDWSNIVQISTGSNHTLGLKKDGTVVATGYRGDDRCNVSNWRDIKSISAGRYHSTAILNEGTVVSTSHIENGYDFGQNQTDNWTNIIEISAGWFHTLGLRADGSIISTNITNNDGDTGQQEIYKWKMEDLYGEQ